MKISNIIVLLILISSTLFSQSFDTSKYRLQNDLLYGLINYLTKPVNSNTENHIFVSTKSLTLNNSALEFIKLKSPDVDASATRYDWIEDLVLENSQDYARINLNNVHLLLDNNYGIGSLISFRKKPYLI